MKIETVRTIKEIEVKETIARYSQEGIKNLVQKDLEAHGYKVENISVITESIYIKDGWGMNRSLTTYLKGIEAVVTPGGLNE